jgi:tight adherence protein C
MNALFYIMAMLTSLCAMGVLASIMLTRTSRVRTQRLLDIALGRQHGGQNNKHPRKLQKKMLEVVNWLRSLLGIGDDPRLLGRFLRAGFTTTSTHRDLYQAARIVGPIIALGLGAIIPSHRIFWMLAFAGVVYLAPNFILERLIKRRREKVRLSVPDAIDLLVICVDAGLGMDQAMLRVGQELAVSHPEIYEEFLQINREQRAGKLRLDAWKSMAERNQLPEMDAFVNMLTQTERFGTPIARALSTFGDGIRLKRRQRAEELAAKTTVKIIFPLVLFIFPAMFVVLLGPAGITIARGLAGAGQ